MQFIAIRRAAVTLGAVAALALGTGLVPAADGSAPRAQAAELAQHGGGHQGGGNMGGHQGGGNNGGGHQGGGNMGGGHNGGGFGGHQYHMANGFHNQYWGWGYHRFYPQYYVAYYYEPVNVCETYYFDDDDGAWYCFVG